MKARHSQSVGLYLARAFTGAYDQPIWLIPFAAAGVLLVQLLPTVLGTWGSWILFGVFLIGGWMWWKWERRVQNVSWKFNDLRPLRVPGLILPVSTLSVRGASEEEKKTIEVLRKALADRFVPLSSAEQGFLERSNLKPAMAALEYHYIKDTSNAGTENGESLRECWLITTEDVPRPGKEEIERGSQEAARLLERWFFTRHPEAQGKVLFHRDKYREIHLTVHPRDYTGMADLVEKIFRKSPYKPEHILAEITPGNKLMTLAVALACLPPKRAMQYMASDRDPFTGEPLSGGEFRPVLIDIDAYVSQSEEE